MTSAWIDSNIFIRCCWAELIFYMSKGKGKLAILYIFKHFAFKWNIIFISYISYIKKEVAKAGARRLGILKLSVQKIND